MSTSYCAVCIYGFKIPANSELVSANVAKGFKLEEFDVVDSKRLYSSWMGVSLGAISIPDDVHLPMPSEEKKGDVDRAAKLYGTTPSLYLIGYTC